MPKVPGDSHDHGNKLDHLAGLDIVPITTPLMKVTFIKQHLQYPAGSTTDLSDAQANYLVRVGVAEAFEGEKISGTKQPEKVKQTHTPKNKDAGPGKGKRK